MTKVIYEVVEHDGGWAYRAEGTFSETFASHDAARKAADAVAAEQIISGKASAISYEDKAGQWHQEYAKENDRPVTEVKG